MRAAQAVQEAVSKSNGTPTPTFVAEEEEVKPPAAAAPEAVVEAPPHIEDASSVVEPPIEISHLSEPMKLSHDMMAILMPE